MNKSERIARLYSRLANAGFSFDEAATLRRIEMTLSRWSEHECNGNIQRDVGSDKPRWYTITHMGDIHRGPIVPDRERGALKRLARIMESHPEYVAYHQGDPRGCALYVVPKSEIERTGLPVGSIYSNGMAVCE